MHPQQTQDRATLITLILKFGFSLYSLYQETERSIHLFYKVNNQLSPEFSCTAHLCFVLYNLSQLAVGTAITNRNKLPRVLNYLSTIVA